VRPVDEGHAAAPHHLAAAAAHHQRRVLVYPQAEQLGIAGHGEEQAVQPPPLGEVGVDHRVEAEQAEAGTHVHVLLLTQLVGLPVGQDRLGERGGAGAGAAHRRARRVRVADRARHGRPADGGHQVHLVAAAEEDPVGAPDERRQPLVLREGAAVHDRELDVRGAGPCEVAPPRARRPHRVAGRGGEADDAPAVARARRVEKRPSAWPSGSQLPPMRTSAPAASSARRRCGWGAGTGAGARRSSRGGVAHARGRAQRPHRLAGASRDLARVGRRSAPWPRARARARPARGRRPGRSPPVGRQRVERAPS
jgi:hypothetical protein